MREGHPCGHACVETKFSYGIVIVTDQKAKLLEFAGLYVSEIELYVEGYRFRYRNG